jgi:hypothetical protein
VKAVEHYRVGAALQTCSPLRLSRKAHISPVPPRPSRPIYSWVSLSPGSRWLCCRGAMLDCAPPPFLLPLRRMTDALQMNRCRLLSCINIQMKCIITMFQCHGM